MPADVAKRLDQLARREFNLANTCVNKQKPKSFGVYLGSFESSEKSQTSQQQILEQWDLLIVDPLQNGVAEAIRHTGSQVFGRIDLARIAPPKETALSIIESVETALINSFNHTAFSGILFANWEDLTTPSIQAKLFEVVSSLGLMVYVETGSPAFLKNRKALQNIAISGLVIRNASIMPTGEKRDYFQMANMQSTIKAFVSESCMRDFAVLTWETVNDDVILSNAIVRRSLSWCNFYSAISWIGNEASLLNADLNIPTPEPLPAFGWLKDADVIRLMIHGDQIFGCHNTPRPRRDGILSNLCSRPSITFLDPRNSRLSLPMAYHFVSVTLPIGLPRSNRKEILSPFRCLDRIMGISVAFP